MGWTNFLKTAEIKFLQPTGSSYIKNLHFLVFPMDGQTYGWTGTFIRGAFLTMFLQVNPFLPYVAFMWRFDFSHKNLP
jgi:hypothetical protein